MLGVCLVFDVVVKQTTKEHGSVNCLATQTLGDFVDLTEHVDPPSSTKLHQLLFQIGIGSIRLVEEERLTESRDLTTCKAGNTGFGGGKRLS